MGYINLKCVTEKYLWQGSTRLLAAYNGDNSLRYRFEYADARMPVAMTDASSNKYYLSYDQVGSLRLVTDNTGNIVKRVDCDTFGYVVNDTNPSMTMPFGFTGGMFDGDTGLIHFGARDYDPDTGRWTAKDPILFDSGDTDLYGYCLNDPVNSVDPYGLVNWGRVFWGGMETIGGGVGIGIAATSEIGSAGVATFAVVGVAGVAAPAVVHGVSEIIAGALENNSNSIPSILPVSVSAVGALLATGNIETAEEVDLATNILLLGGSALTGEWLESLGKSAGFIIDYLNTRHQLKDMSHTINPCSR